MEELKLGETLGGLIIVAGMVLIVYFIARYTYQIKKMLAEKGMLSQSSETRLSKTDVAYTIIGIGVGLLISAGLSLMNLEEDTLDLLAWGIILITGSIGLILSVKKR